MRRKRRRRKKRETKRNKREGKRKDVCGKKEIKIERERGRI